MRTGDGKIVSRRLNGEPEAFGMLVDKYKASIYALVYSKIRNFHDAEDVTQDIFIKAYCNLRTLRQHEDFHWWLYSISYNYCRNWLRAKSNRPDSEFIEDQNPEIIEKILSDPSMAVYQDDIVNEDIHTALNSLPKDYREVLILYYLGGMDSVEIAKALGTSPTAIRQRLSRAREQFRGEVLAMMGATYSQQKLTATFTFRIVETVKNIKINPVSTIKGLPCGLSLATGIIIAVMSLNPYVSWFSQIGAYARSVLPSETKVLKVGEIPVDIVKTSSMAILADKMGKGKGGEPKQLNENAFLMAPKVEGGEWQMKSDNPTPHWGSSACEVNGKIYLIGGLTLQFIGVNTVQEYDPILDKWTKKKDMPTPRGWLSTIAIDGLIYAIGGFQENRDGGDFPNVEVYDPAKDEWTRKKDMPTPRRLFAIGAVNGKIYCIGGCQVGPAFSMVEEYDIKTDTWTRKADMPTARYGVAAEVVNNKIYAMGGGKTIAPFDVLKTVEEYDTLLDKWTKKTDMPTQRIFLDLSVVDNEIYAIGGSTTNELNLNASSIVEKYNPIEDKWYRLEDMLIQRHGVSSAVFNNKIYVMTGSAHFPEPVPTVEEYTPDTSTFSIFSKGKLPTKWGNLKSR